MTSSNRRTRTLRTSFAASSSVLAVSLAVAGCASEVGPSDPAPPATPDGQVSVQSTPVCTVPNSTACITSTEMGTCTTNGRWFLTPCSTACLGTACTVCSPGATRCYTSDNQHYGIETCTSVGQWSSPVACGGLDGCVEGVCTTCEPGTTQCTGGATVGTSIQVCTPTGNWNVSSPCPHYCIEGICG